jgi:fumarate reductase flavoprotein subunit
MASKLEHDLIVESETLEEPAQKMKGITPEMDVEFFKFTVDRYNELCKIGSDLDFGKRPDRLFPVKNPPFYAQWKKSALFLVTLGGLIVNEKLQPTDKFGKPILGLYCAGNTVGRRFGLYYPLMLPGLSHGMALTYGYIAGKNVSKDT